MPLLEDVARLLDEAGLEYVKEDGFILMEWETRRFSDLKVGIATSPDEDWLFIIAWLLDLSEVSREEWPSLFYSLLRENYAQNGVKYGIDDEDVVFASIETADTDLTVEEIRNYIFSLLEACDSFAERYLGATGEGVGVMEALTEAEAISIAENFVKRKAGTEKIEITRCERDPSGWRIEGYYSLPYAGVKFLVEIDHKTGKVTEYHTWPLP
nr:YbjN domain-containing protein [Candidatus Freyrarchaeum guaymaensis]